jgi:hypothetical protein
VVVLIEHSNFDNLTEYIYSLEFSIPEVVSFAKKYLITNNHRRNKYINWVIIFFDGAAIVIVHAPQSRQSRMHRSYMELSCVT